MSESQNNNQDPNNVDEEQSRSTGAPSAPQDVSGSFKLAQNPEQFFQGSISANENDGTTQTRSFSFASSQFNPDPSAPAFNPNVLNPEPSAVLNPEPSASLTPQIYNPEPSASYNPGPADVYNPEPSASIHPGLASHPDSSGAFNPDPAADYQGNDFFDTLGRQAQPQSFASQPQVFGQSEQEHSDTGIIPNNSKSARAPQPQDGRRLPGGFFDVPENAGPGTAPGAAPNQQPAANQFAYQPGVTAQQAFFAGNDAPQLPAPTPQTSAFQDFQEKPSPVGEQFPQGGQPAQSPGPGSAQAPYQYGVPQPQQQMQNQQIPQQYAPQPAQYPSSPAQNPLPQPNAAPLEQNSLNLNQNSASDQSPSAVLQGSSGEKTSAPVGRKKRRRRRLEDDQPPANDFTQSEIEMDTFKRFEKLVVNPETKGLAMLAFHEARQILTQPEEFFRTMPTRGNIAEPAIFLFILAGISGLLAGVISMNLLITIQFIIGNILQAYLLSFICWKMYTGMGSMEPFETTFRVVAYSQATLIIAGLKFSIFGNWLPAYITLAIATALALRLQIIGMKHVHDMPSGKVMPVLVLATLFILLIRFKIFLL